MEVSRREIENGKTRVINKSHQQLNIYSLNNIKIMKALRIALNDIKAMKALLVASRFRVESLNDERYALLRWNVLTGTHEKPT